MSMNRPDYEASYRRLQAFVECSGREATHNVSKCGASTLSPGKPCYTREGGTLSLCGPCLHFWQECQEHDDQTTWELAIYLRDIRSQGEPF